MRADCLCHLILVQIRSLDSVAATGVVQQCDHARRARRRRCRVRVREDEAHQAEDVVRHMRRGLHNAAEMREACRDLAAMMGTAYPTEEEGALREERRARAGAAGAVEAVVAVMRAHAEAVGVQENGCEALRNMAADNPENRARSRVAGAVEAVVAAMRAHKFYVLLQENGFGALYTMSVDSHENQARARAAGAPEAVASAMRTHARGNCAWADAGAPQLLQGRRVIALLAS